MRHKVSRRRFLAAACVGAAVSARKRAYSRESSPKLAVLGGKAVRNQPFPSWPVIGDNDEKAWLDVLRSRSWNRLGGTRVDQFEKSWAAQLGAGHRRSLAGAGPNARSHWRASSVPATALPRPVEPALSLPR